MVSIGHVGQIQPPFDALDTLFNPIQAHRLSGKVLMQQGHVLFDMRQPEFNIGNIVLQVIDFAVESAQVLKDQAIGFGHFLNPYIDERNLLRSSSVNSSLCNSDHSKNRVNGWLCLAALASSNAFNSGSIRIFRLLVFLRFSGIFIASVNVLQNVLTSISMGLACACQYKM